MTLPDFSALDGVIHKIRQQQNIDLFKAVVGNSFTDNALINVPSKTGWVYVRQIQDNGTYGVPIEVKANGWTELYLGAPVKIGRDSYNDLRIEELDFEGAVRQGVNPATNNSGGNTSNNSSGSVNQSQITTALCTVFDPADTIFVIWDWIYERYGVANRLNYQQIDVVSYIPSAGTHVAILIANTYDNVIEVVSGVERDVNDPLLSGITIVDDLNELLLLMSPGSTPLWVSKLTGGQTSLGATPLLLDLRDIVKVNIGNDNPNNVNTPTLIPSGRNAVWYGGITVSSVLKVDGRLKVI